jgi:hypothetical protein
MNSVKTIRSLRELLNQVYLTYGMTNKIPQILIDQIEKEITDTEPRIVEASTVRGQPLGNDIIIRPEPESNRCVHTEHCCKIHGCKYGDDDDECAVANDTKSQSFPCQVCREQEEDWFV